MPADVFISTKGFWSNMRKNFQRGVLGNPVRGTGHCGNSSVEAVGCPGHQPTAPGVEGWEFIKKPSGVPSHKIPCPVTIESALSKFHASSGQHDKDIRPSVQETVGLVLLEGRRSFKGTPTM